MLYPAGSQEALNQQLKDFAIQFLAWNAFGAFVGIDWRAHMGGMAAGAALAWAAGPRLHREWGLFGGKIVDKPLVDVRARFRGK